MRMQGDLNWNKILYRYSEHLLQFVLKAQLNVLPTLDNLNRWKLISGGRCSLCGDAFPTLLHVLTNCRSVLSEENDGTVTENRYKWRHNCVLRTLAQAIRQKLAFVNNLPADLEAPDSLQRPLHFAKAGSAARDVRLAKEKSRRGIQLGLLAEARDWVCDFDLPEFHRPPRPPFGFPIDVGATSTRIDAFIVSRQARVCIAGPELTVPMEKNVDVQHAAKLKKYSGLASCLSQGWRLGGLLCLEMGCRGVDPPSFGNVLRQLAFTSSEVRQLRDDCSYIARYCSYLIWLHRNKSVFVLPRVYCAGGRVLMDRRSVVVDDSEALLERSVP